MRASGLLALLLAVGCDDKNDGQDGAGGDDIDTSGGTVDTETGGGGDTDETGETGEDTGPPIPATIATVCNDGTADYPSIQAGIDAVEPGWTLEICAGTWREQLVIEGKGVTLKGTEGAALTILDGSRVGTVITVRGNTDPVVIQGLTVTNGDADIGGAILCEDGALDVVESIVRDNTGNRGGGVAASRCVVNLTGSQFLDNRAYDDGPGALLEESTGLVDGNVFSGGTGWHGGGIKVFEGAVTISNNEFRNNHVQGTGGSVWLGGTQPHRFINNIVADSSSLDIGGGLYAGLTVVDISDNEFTGNRAFLDGGAVYIGDSTGYFARNVVTENFTEDDAAGVRVFRSQLLFEENVVSFNEALGAGGGVKASHEVSDFLNNTFEGNVSGEYGGGLEVDDNNSFLSGNVFIDNYAYRGGGLHVNENFYVMRVEDSVFQGNVAEDCGGAFASERWDGDDHLEPTPVYYDVEFVHALVVGNRATGGGGFCGMQGDTVVWNSVFAANQAEDGGGAWFGSDGDTGPYGTTGGSAFRNVVFHGNRANNGAGISQNGASISVVNTIISGNYGPGVSKSGGSVTAWSHNDVWGNDPDYDGVSDPGGGDGNISANPSFRDVIGDDFGLGAGSPCIDAGSADSRDPDGSPTDIGAYGGSDGDW